MAGLASRKRLAADSNLLFDLAAEQDFAHTFREVFQDLGYAIEVCPTVVQELTLKATQSESSNPSADQQRTIERARIGLSSMLEWGIRPFDLVPTGHGLTELFSNLLRDRRLLPEGEFNDGLILAECALAGIPLLVTSDEHLLDIDGDRLRLCFEERDLPVVAVAHPKNLLRAVNVKSR